MSLNPILFPLIKPTCIAIAVTEFSFRCLHSPPWPSPPTVFPPPPPSFPPPPSQSSPQPIPGPVASPYSSSSSFQHHPRQFIFFILPPPPLFCAQPRPSTIPGQCVHDRHHQPHHHTSLPR
ncbi:extensin-like [Glycine soja]|uniref:extensin-like n=1 Tax=Glycine soja TaxID=3848 RepID=UPI00103E57D0|nr:extensin-like [Glycine soja]